MLDLRERRGSFSIRGAVIVMMMVTAMAMAKADVNG
jgi:hypothetical protein